MTFTDEELRMAVRAQLPPEIFKRNPWRLIHVVLLLAFIVACGWGAMHTRWYAAIPLSLAAGHAYGSLMFFAHEIAHGAVVSSRRVQDLVLYLASAIFCLSPRFWRLWHNGVHHAHANVDVRDPDHFGTVERYDKAGFARRFIIDYAPGSGRLLSIIYPFVFFTGQCHGVLWFESVYSDEFRSLERRRPQLESILMFLGWVALCVATGLRGTIYLVAIPMLVANCTVMSYIFTNHLLRPLKERASSLDGTMSVKTIGLIDRLHFHFSHHIEHHLFPSVGSNHYPRIRAVLQELVGDRYLAPAHWWAILVLYRTPRLYDTPTEVIEPRTGRRVALASVEELLAMH